jgi:hypothetical protein
MAMPVPNSVLHEPAVFGLREKWIVRSDAANVSTAEIVTPALPEVRVLLRVGGGAIVAARVFYAASRRISVDREGSLIGRFDRGAVPDAIDHLLHDPAAHVQAAVADGAQQTILQTD